MVLVGYCVRQLPALDVSSLSLLSHLGFLLPPSVTAGVARGDTAETLAEPSGPVADAGTPLASDKERATGPHNGAPVARPAPAAVGVSSSPSGLGPPGSFGVADMSDLEEAEEVVVLVTAITRKGVCLLMGSACALRGVGARNSEACSQVERSGSMLSGCKGRSGTLC